MNKIILCFFLLLFFSFSAKADIYTHTLGDAGYMIREAEHAGANRLAKDVYRQALKKQKAAKDALKRNARAESLNLAKEAYNLAKEARDLALGKKNEDTGVQKRCPGRIRNSTIRC